MSFYCFELRAEDCELFAVDIPALLEDKETYSKFFQILLEMSGDFFTEERLSSMASNPRHQLYVLMGPNETWNADEPFVYCAIQVYLEGQIGLPECNEMVSEKINDYYLMFQRLPPLVGARIVHICNLMENPSLQGAYESVALSLLTRCSNYCIKFIIIGSIYAEMYSHYFDQKRIIDTSSYDVIYRYYNGEMVQDAAEVVLQTGKQILTQLQSKRWKVMHYLGIITEPNSNELSRWVGRDFSLLFVGKIKDESQVRCVMLRFLRDFDLQISNHNKDCTPNDLFRYSRSIFINCLSFSPMRILDHVFALRVIKLKFDHEDVHLVTRKPWSELDDKRINSYIKNPFNRELVLHIIPAIAIPYFEEKLPLTLSTNEEFVLLMHGLQKQDFFHIRKLLNVPEEEIDNLFQEVLAKATDYFDSRNPEVVDG
ncbi:RNA cytidine acetyltransferase 2-like [Coffea eugenioides]|uniref:RNA cytidine acetyltransferase 2-like n=1 Tax=Coffea eugenioides TaxID=49369 RepID=UPI000F612E2F|nr:RNA cytidine acetyltransferase 2-like [Coffea eugenioides]